MRGGLPLFVPKDINEQKKEEDKPSMEEVVDRRQRCLLQAHPSGRLNRQ